MSDLRQIAERLAKARPERFEFQEKGHAWAITDARRDMCIGSWPASDYPDKHWAFWGPLSDEFEVRSSNVALSRPRSLLDALAEAVVTALEAQAREK